MPELMLFFETVQLFGGHGDLGRRLGHHRLPPLPLHRQVEGDAEGIHVVAGSSSTRSRCMYSKETLKSG